MILNYSLGKTLTYHGTHQSIIMIWWSCLSAKSGLLISIVQTTIKHGNKDLLVHSNGTIEHMVIMNTVVGCEVNLYNYPFASDFCPIAINVRALR
ncbi:unnamed protein product, partial [Coregonus sp. 'balchen']